MGRLMTNGLRLNSRMQRFPGQRSSTAMVLVVLFLGAGCSRRPDAWQRAQPATFPVTGIVTTRGAPIENATVVFLSHPQHPDWKWGEVAAFGETDDRGRFQLRTFREGDGAVAGTHAVLIQKTTYTPRSPTADGDPANVVEKHLLPEKYRNRATTPFSAEVTDSGPREYRFDLE